MLGDEERHSIFTNCVPLFPVSITVFSAQDTISFHLIVLYHELRGNIELGCKFSLSFFSSLQQIKVKSIYLIERVINDTIHQPVIQTFQIRLASFLREVEADFLRFFVTGHAKGELVQ
jgi:hypothetical protein